MLWEHEPQASVSTAFSSYPKLSQVFVQLDRNTEYMFSICFRKHHDNKKKENNLVVNFDYKNVNFSLLAPSLHQQRTLVLCLHWVIQTQFLPISVHAFLRLFSK